MQLSLDAADRLVELVEERRGPVPAEDAARALFALRHVPAGLARSLLDDVVAGTRGSPGAGRASRSPTRRARRCRSRTATYFVVDLETTGLSPGRSRDLRDRRGAGRGLELAERFQTLVNPRQPLPAADRRADRHRRARRCAARRRSSSRCGGSSSSPATPCSSRTTRASTSASSTARSCGSPAGGSPHRSSTPSGSRGELLAGRSQRVGLASLAHFFGTATRPCHRALPDAEATAEILLALIGLAQERGATHGRRARRARGAARAAARRQALARSARRRGPGVYLFRDRNEQVLYVGRARDLRARLRSYFRSERQRPAVEAALGGARADRVARARLRARGGARGAAAAARAAAAGERAQHPARPLRLPAPARSRLVRHATRHGRTGR